MADAPDQKPNQSGPDAVSHSDPAIDSQASEHIISIASATATGGGTHQHTHHHRKVKLMGRVGEEEACSLLTDRSEIVVGSGADCDLVLADPLVPARAFMLKHVKEHGGVHENCGSCWQLQAYPGARIFINRHIAQRELLHFGDAITAGCHQVFFLEGDADILNRRTQVEVQGICRELISAVPTPAGFLHSCASWRDRVRTQAAARWGGGLAAALLLALLITPRARRLDPATDFMSVVIVPEQSSLPMDESKAVLSRIGKRPINSVARRTVTVQDQVPDSPDQLSSLAPPTGDPAQAPLLREPVIAPQAAPVLQERVVADAGTLGAGAPSLGVADGVPQMQLTREVAKLTTGTTGARQTQDETAPEASPRELAELAPQSVNREPPTLAMSSTSNLNPGPSSLERVTSDAGTLGVPQPIDAKPMAAMPVMRNVPASLAKGTGSARQTREESVAVSGAEGTLQVMQSPVGGAEGTDPRAMALTLTGPAAPGAAPGGRLIQDVGAMNPTDSFVVNVGPSAAVGRAAPKLEKGGAAQRQIREEALALASAGAGLGAGGDALQTFQPQAGTGDPQAVAMSVGPALKPVSGPVGRVAQDAGAFAGGGSSIVNAGPQVAVGRGAQRLTRGASGPRQSHAEHIAAFGVPGGSMQTYQPRLDGKGPRVVITNATGRIAHVASTGKLETNRTEVVGAMQMNASPLDFTEYRGHRIPVARMADALSTLTISDGGQGHILDGSVSSSEVATSWKSGRFRVHGPGQPPAAEPATQCYVGKTKVNGKDYLYMGFVCSDPNPGQIVVTHPNGGMYTERDDSIEIFLDTRNSRQSYNHMIVNARGGYVAYFCPDSDKGINGQGTPWDPGAQIKTAINHELKQWTCEVLIPFDRLGGMPAKGSQWPVNFSRNFRGQGHPQQVLSSWFLVYEGNTVNYHHPRLFGLFQW